MLPDQLTAESPSEDPAAGTITPEVVKSGMIRAGEAEAPEASRAALVTKWQGTITLAKTHWKDDFERMQNDQSFLRGAQWDGKENPDKYTANVIQRHIGQRVAALYAKNPTVVVRKRKTLDFKEWDGTSDALQTLQMAVETAATAGMPLPPQALSLIADISQGVSRKKMLEKISDTLQIIYDYTLNQQLPPFKLQMKQLIRRVCTTGIGYVKLGFTRVMERSPEDTERVNGLTEQISVMQRIMADQVDGEINEGAAELEQLRLQLSDYQSREEEIAREGVSFDFPSSTSIIIDPACRHLRTFIGARWIAEEFILSVADVKEIYGVDLGSSATATSYSTGESTGIPGLKEKIRAAANGGEEKKRRVEGICVWVVWDKTTGQTFAIAEGHSDFLVEPKAPDIFLSRFWPIFPLTFNESEDEDGLFPRSDVHLLRPIQLEINRCREGLRQHRVANRPGTAVAAGQFDETDIALLKTRPPNAVVTLNALPPGGDIDKLLQPLRGAPIDPALYDTSAMFEDIMRVIGQSDAGVGAAQAGVTATGDSIAEQNRTVSLASNVDDLDDMLVELSRSAGQILLTNLTQETAMKIAGPGAVWPTLSGQEIAEELLLEIEAGSSGRPNKATEIANMERLAPILLQIPGVRPDWLLKQIVTRLDDKLDVQEIIAAGLPAIIVQNAMTKVMQAGAPGGPTSNIPGEQGGEGGDNAPKMQQAQPQGAPSAPPTLPAGG